MARIPVNAAKPFLWLDAVLAGGTVRRSVRNYGGSDPEELGDGELPHGAAAAVLGGVKRELRIKPVDFIHQRMIPRFIGSTTGRSGTTWLQNVLRRGISGSHVVVREVGLFDLAQFRGAPYEYFQYANLKSRHVYRRYFRDFVLDRAYFIRRRFDGTLLGICDLVPKRVVRLALDHLEERLETSRSLQECEQAFGDFYIWLYNAHAKLVGGDRPWISKEPPYGRHVDQLLAMVPTARVVILVRDGRDAALSMYRGRWHASLEDAIDRWRHFTEMTISGLSAVAEDRALVVRYRDLVFDFDSAIERVCDFFEVPLPDLQRLHSDPDLAPRASSIGGWKGEFTTAEERYFRESCEHLMNHFDLPL